MNPHTLGYPSIWGCIPNIRVLHYMWIHPNILGYPNTRGCFDKYWGTQVCGNASPYTGIPQYMGMHPHILGYPNIWGCIPIYWGTPLYGTAPQRETTRQPQFATRQRRTEIHGLCRGHGNSARFEAGLTNVLMCSGQPGTIIWA